MGNWLSRLSDVLQAFSSSHPSRIIMLGLDGTGKTTALYRLVLNETLCTSSNAGINIETMAPVKGISFTVWDVGGQEEIRPLWKHYYNGMEGLVFVVDSSDSKRLKEAWEELHGILESPDMAAVPVVIMANKQDLPGSLSSSHLVSKLELRSLKNPWHVQATCATNGEGVVDAMQTMAKMVKNFRKKKQSTEKLVV